MGKEEGWRERGRGWKGEEEGKGRGRGEVWPAPLSQISGSAPADSRNKYMSFQLSIQSVNATNTV